MVYKNTRKRNSSKLYKWCYENGLTMAQFADQLQICTTTIALWAMGTRKPTPIHMMMVKKLTRGKISTPKDLVNEPLLSQEE